MLGEYMDCRQRGSLPGLEAGSNKRKPLPAGPGTQAQIDLIREGIPKSLTAHTPRPSPCSSLPKPTPEETKLFEGRQLWLGLAFKDKNSADFYFLGILGKVTL